MLCRFRNALGEPGKGFHAARLGPLASWDTLGTVAIGAVLGHLLRINLLFMIATLFVLAAWLHRLFCVDTALNVLIFGRCHSS